MTLIEKIEELKPWYQQVDFGEGIKSPGQSDCGEFTWPFIRKFLPDLSGLRFLDLGTNTGIHCIRAILEGAREAIGVDNNDAPMATKQQVFVKEFFEKKYNTKLNIQFIEDEVEDYIFNYSSPEKFDVILAFSVLHHFRSSRHKEFIMKLGLMTNTVLVRFRAGTIDKNYAFFDKLFFECGFRSRKFKEKEASPHLFLACYEK